MEKPWLCYLCTFYIYDDVDVHMNLHDDAKRKAKERKALAKKGEKNMIPKDTSHIPKRNRQK